MQKKDSLKAYINSNTLRCCLFICFVVMVLKLIVIDVASGDYTQFLSVWIKHLRENGGFEAISTVEADYNAIYLYFLALFTYLPINDLYLIKFLSFIFDFVLAIGAFKIVSHFYKDNQNKNYYSFLAFACILLMPTAFSNSALWGQCDSIYTAFVIFTLYFMLEEKYNLAFIMYGFALTFKLQAIFILPCIGIIFLKNRNFSILKFLWIPIVNIICYIPAVMCGRPISSVFDAYFCQVGEYSYKTVFGYPNIYYFFSIDNIDLIKPGIILTLLLLIFLMIFVLFTKGKLSKKEMLHLSILVIFLVTFFLPKMHDRYGYAGEMLSVIYFIIIKKDWHIFALININTILNYLSYTCVVPEEYMPFVAISQGMVVVYFAYTFIKGRIDKHNSLKSVKS